MRVELLNHSPDAVLYKPVLINGVDIKIGDGKFSNLKLSQRTRLAEVEMQLCISRLAIEHDRHKKNGAGDDLLAQHRLHLVVNIHNMFP